MQTIAGRLRAAHGSKTSAVAVSSLLDDTVRGVRPALLSLLAAGGLLILIACANVANLLLARGVGRRREIAIRQVMGAGRGRVVRQLVVESVPLVLLSAVAGLALAHWSFSGLVAMVPFSIPRRAEISVGTPALIFGLLVSCAAGLLFAFAPALQTSTRHLTNELTAASRTVSSRDGGLRKALVAGQFALALALLSCAGLLTKSFVRLAQVDAGFDHQRALVVETELPATPYSCGCAAERVLARRDRTGGCVAGGRVGRDCRIGAARRRRTQRHGRAARCTRAGRRRVVWRRHGGFLPRARYPVAPGPAVRSSATSLRRRVWR